MKPILTAIIDNKADEIVGKYIYIHKHMATAVRQFQDAADDKGSMLNKHTEDFDLWKLGELNEDNSINAAPELIMKGTVLKAAMEKQTEVTPLRPMGAR